MDDQPQKIIDPTEGFQKKPDEPAPGGGSGDATLEDEDDGGFIWYEQTWKRFKDGEVQSLTERVPIDTDVLPPEGWSRFTVTLRTVPPAPPMEAASGIEAPNVVEAFNAFPEAIEKCKAAIDNGIAKLRAQAQQAQQKQIQIAQAFPTGLPPAGRNGNGGGFKRRNRRRR